MFRNHSILVRWAVGGIAVAAAASVIVARARAQAPIRVSINEVIVPVTVTDDKGKFVSDLTQQDFRIFDEGKEQKIDYFSHDPHQPVVIGFLLDMSNGMKIHWERYKEAATDLMLNLLPGDKRFSGYLITYGNEPELVADTNSDSEKMVEKLAKMKPAGGSALFDAIYMACSSRKTINGEPYEPRRVVIIIGDGHDSASKKSLKEVEEIAQRNLVTIYAMSTQAFGFRSDGQDALEELTTATGGREVIPLTNIYKDVSGYLSNPQDAGNYAITVGTGQYTAEVSSAIFRAVADISGEITTQYVLRYVPDTDSKTDAKVFRRIRVAVNLPNAVVRYRQGYYPAAAAQ